MRDSEYRVAALFRYPLKSAAGVAAERLELDRFGVRDDRRWMMIDAHGAPLTQREYPALALLHAGATPDGLALEWRGPGGGRADVPRPGRDAPRRKVTIWGDTLTLPLADDRSNAWLSTAIGRPASLAWMPADVERPVNPRYARADDRTSLTDGYPLHVIGSGSMEDLNRRLARPLGVERFRPNVFVEGPAPYDEDEWAGIRIGACELRVVKPCPRCAVTTVDPTTGVRGKEPLATLSAYRKRAGGVMFGQNAVHDGEGVLRVGDPVVVLSRRDARGG